MPGAPKISIPEAAARLEGVTRRTPLVRFDCADPRIELRLKLECLQETGSFKARGAWNQVSQLEDAAREAGVVATSSGNHGRALAWAAERAGIKARIFMPADAYPNKIEACRTHGAEVILCPTREAAEEACGEAVRLGATLVHPFDAARTVEGAGTVGFEVARDWPEVEVVVVPCGGGGLIAGSALAIHEELHGRAMVFGAEPAGAPTMKLALEAKKPVVLRDITTSVQGLCPLSVGELNARVALEHVEDVFPLSDRAILAAQAQLVRATDWVVEPAGAAAPAAVFDGALPAALLRDRDASNPLRVAAVVSGGNPDPRQLASLRDA